jgi:hypothetical protein
MAAPKVKQRRYLWYGLAVIGALITGAWWLLPALMAGSGVSSGSKSSSGGGSTGSSPAAGATPAPQSSSSGEDPAPLTYKGDADTQAYFSGGWQYDAHDDYQGPIGDDWNTYDTINSWTKSALDWWNS